MPYSEANLEAAIREAERFLDRARALRNAHVEDLPVQKRWQECQDASAAEREAMRKKARVEYPSHP